MERKKTYRTWAEVDLEKIRENVLSGLENVPEGMKLCAVVKTDAYGHGAVPVARALSDIAYMYAVATVDEGAELREGGILQPVLCLGPVPEQQYRAAVEAGLTLTVFTLPQAEALSEACRAAGRDVSVHLAVDTGMARIGLRPQDDPGQALREALAIAAVPHVHVEGVFTHFATADEIVKGYTMEQLRIFRDFTDLLEKCGLRGLLRHCANSAGIIENIGTEFDMVRDGICIYGVYPSDEVPRDRVLLTPALSWRAEVSFVKQVPAGTHVSYGSTWTAPQDTLLATVAAGYGDGYPRRLSGKGYVLIRGHRCPIRGRVCMDQFMVDVSEVPEVRAGDTATLLGQDGMEKISVYDWERLAGCFTYETLCGIGKRVPRVYRG